MALCQISHRSQIVVYEKVIHEKKLSTTSGLMSTVLLINIDISSLSLIFSTDSQEPSHTTLNGLLFDMKISLVLLDEFIYLSGPVKKFSYHYILFQGTGLSYGALTTSNCATTNRLSQILTKKQERKSILVTTASSTGAKHLEYFLAQQQQQQQNQTTKNISSTSRLPDFFQKDAHVFIKLYTFL